MSTVPHRGHVPASTGHESRAGRRARWAVGLAAVAGAMFAASIVTVAITYGVGREGAIEDNWLGALLASLSLVGVAGSLAAFVLAITARVARERWAWLWLPLCLFPACLLFVVLGEAFWWE